MNNSVFEIKEWGWLMEQLTKIHVQNEFGKPEEVEKITKEIKNQLLSADCMVYNKENYELKLHLK